LPRVPAKVSFLNPQPTLSDPLAGVDQRITGPQELVDGGAHIRRARRRFPALHGMVGVGGLIVCGLGIARITGARSAAAQGPRGHPNLAEAPSVTARRFYYDTVCYGSKPAFLCALEAFGPDHIVTGSDYPVLQDWEVYRETFAYIERLGLPKEVTDKILHHNAPRLFGFDH
jgi:hypothetical protein